MATTDSITLPISEQPDSENWRDVDTSTREGEIAIKRAIALRLGWQVKSNAFNAELQDVFSPTGACVEFLLNETGLDNFWYMNHVPDYTRDATAALSLIEDERFDVRILRERAINSWFCEIGNVWDGAFYNTDKSLALAICLAWLAWWDVRNADAQARQQKGGA